MRFFQFITTSSFLFCLLFSTCSVDARLRVPRDGSSSSSSTNASNEPRHHDQEQDLPHIHTRKLQGVKLEGHGGKPNDDYIPLQLCEGDCDEDSDCDVGLVCFQREARTAVPGCIGGEEENSKTDFCIADPSLATNAATAQAATARPSTLAPAPAAAASHRPTSAPTTKGPTGPAPTVPAPAPGTTAPTFQPTTEATTEYTNDGTEQGMTKDNTAAITESGPPLKLDSVGNNGSPSGAYPLGLCQGDCDDDTDCADGLICFQRDQNDPVPGCLGHDGSRNDYCILDPSAIPTPAPTVKKVIPTAAPTTRRPTTAPTIHAPTMSPQPTLRPTVSPNPTSPPSDIPSNTPTDLPSVSPSVSLVPTLSPPPTTPPSGAPTVHPVLGVRIKLYWEEGYMWQDETIERKWCMISDYRGFPGTGKCWHGLSTEPCHPDMVYVARCDSDRRQMFSIIPMPGGTQYQLSLYAENLCFERYEYDLMLRKCDYMNPLQRFWIPRGALYQKRFELSPITLPNYCFSQAHHPKSGEVVKLFRCSEARSEENQSSFWNLY